MPRRKHNGMETYEPMPEEPVSRYASMEQEGPSRPNDRQNSGLMRDEESRLKYADYKPEGLDDEEEQVYIVKQQYGVLSILFSLVQTIILAIMMWQCGIAPMNLK